MSNEILEKIKSRGYWHVLIRPKRFIEERIPHLPECEQIISRYQIQHRGWYFPHINLSDIRRGVDYIEMSTSFMGINESWRFFQSGQFVFYRGLKEDWFEDQPQWPGGEIKPGAVLALTTPLFQLSEVYEFASRLGQARILDREVRIFVNLVKTQGRILWSWPGEGRYLSRVYRCDVNELPRDLDFEVSDLIARHADHSYSHFVWITERFGFEPSEAVFKRDQEKFFEGRY
jgi:hypothetical protein